MDRVIVTGGNGFIGRHVVKKILSSRPSSVAVIANTSNIHVSLFRDKKVIHNYPLTFYSADIRDKKTISKIFQHEQGDTCIHLAAKISVSESIKNPDETMNINVKGTLNVLEACSNNNVKNFVFASSAAVYGDVTELPISESHKLRPLSPYGKSKMLAEQLVLSFNKLKKIQNTISLRIFNVYGVGQTSESDVVTRFAARLSKGLPPLIIGDGRHTRDFISVDDVAEAVLLSIRVMEGAKTNSNSTLGMVPVFNIGTGKATSVKELAEKMIAISGLEMDPIYEEENQDKVILHSYANMTKAKNILHFVAKKDFHIGLREILEPMRVSGKNPIR